MDLHKRRKLKVKERRPMVARMYLEHQTQAAIAQELGVNQSTISRDLDAIQKAWLESSLRDFDEARAQELAKIDNLELEYWEAWQRSKEDFTSKTIKARGVNPKEETYKEADQTTKREDRNGDPRFLQGIQWCIDRRCKLLGLDAPDKLEIDWRQQLPEGYDPDEVQRQFVELMAVAAQGNEDDDSGD